MWGFAVYSLLSFSEDCQKRNKEKTIQVEICTLGVGGACCKHKNFEGSYGKLSVPFLKIIFYTFTFVCCIVTIERSQLIIDQVLFILQIGLDKKDLDKAFIQLTLEFVTKQVSFSKVPSFCCGSVQLKYILFLICF